MPVALCPVRRADGSTGERTGVDSNTGLRGSRRRRHRLHQRLEAYVTRRLAVDRARWVIPEHGSAWGLWPGELGRLWVGRVGAHIDPAFPASFQRVGDLQRHAADPLDLDFNGLAV